MVGDSPRMRDVYQFIARVAPTRLHGPDFRRKRNRQGTGGARDPSQQQPRNKPCVAINCAALAESCSKASCSGTRRARSPAPSRRRRASWKSPRAAPFSWTKSASWPPLLQAKMLRVLQEREFERVGGTRTIKLDVRLIAATNRDLEEEVKSGALPRGSVLPAERGFAPHARPARAPRRHPAAGQLFRLQVRAADPTGP